MTEKEKCRLGLLYDANYDPEILADRERAKELLYDYNRLRPFEQIRRTELLKKLLGKTGENLIIEPPFACDYGYNIEVGENFYANVNLVILDGAKVCIGDNILNYIGLKSWSNGNQGTHYTIFYSLLFYIPSLIIGYKFNDNFGSKVGNILSTIMVTIIIVTSLLFTAII